MGEEGGGRERRGGGGGDAVERTYWRCSRKYVRQMQ